MANKRIDEIATSDYNDWESAFTTVNDRIKQLEEKRTRDIERLRLNLAESTEKKLLQAGKKNEQELAAWKEKVAKAAQQEEANQRKKAQQELANWDKQQLVDQYNYEKQLIRENAELEKQYREASRNNQIQNIISKVTGGNISDSTATILSDKLTTAIDKLGEKLDNAIDSAMDTYSRYQGSINARLVGSEKTFKSMMDGNAKSSPFYKTSDYINNLNDLVSQGIAYNVEQRAFIQTMKDKIVTTFDATNGTLLRLIKLQNSDSTAARMGMEAMLTEYLNNMYMNTEYLSNQYDNVSGALVEAESLLGTQASAELEYVVQKWLGSLSSVGLSDSAVSSIAQSLGYLGSGNVNSLVGTDVGNLMAMAISKANLSYADILKEGLTVENTDKIMSSLVEYLQYIADSSNNVVMSQLANIFGMSVSDIQSAKNVNVDTVVGNNLSYSGGLGKLSARLTNDFSFSSIMSGNGAITIAEAYDNIVQNAIFSIGSAIADNGVQYGIYKAASLVEDYTSGMISAGAKAVNKLASYTKIGSIGVAALESLIDVAKGTSVMGFNIIDMFNAFGDTTMGSARSGSTSSAKAIVNNDGSVTLTTGSSDTSTVKAEAQADTEKETKISEAPLKIQDYLINTFDAKMTTLLALTAGGNNYSVAGFDTSKFIGVISGDSVAISANTDDNSDKISAISASVLDINILLHRLISGESQMYVKMDAAATLMSGNQAIINTLTKTIGG